MSKLIEVNNVNVMQNRFTKDCVVSAWDVKNAISKLKDGNFVLNTGPNGH